MYMNLSGRPTNPTNEDFTDDWDHSIYILGTNYNANSKIVSSVSNPVKLDRLRSGIAKYIAPFSDSQCKKLKIKGYAKNIDILVN